MCGVRRRGPTITQDDRTDERPIFLSFRDDDARRHAVRLYKALSGRLSCELIFDFLFDPVAWVGELIDTVRRSAVVLVLIGPKWLDILSERRARGESFSDAVHVELLAAFQHKVPLLVVLVEDTSAPTPASLPPELLPLIAAPSVRVRSSCWQPDLDAIVEAIERSRSAA
jgi:hypothetical protein